MTRFLPKDSQAKLFQIGTRPLDPEDWLAPDDQRDGQMREKARLRLSHPDQTFAELAQSRPAQAELLALLIDYLPRRFPHLWARSGSGLAMLPTGEVIDVREDRPPLAQAAALVQDDLLLLERDEQHWRLVAASLSFPSSWVLQDKIGQALDRIHEPVPGFGPATRPAQIMARMFDALRPDSPMIRWNWSLYGDDRLYHPRSSDPDQPRFGEGARADPVYLRVERQTLRKLPRTGAIAFTIRINLVSLDHLSRQPDAAELAAQLQGEVVALSAEQLAYKGLLSERDRVLERLREICQSSKN